MKATPATGVPDGHEAGVLELTLGVQPPPPPPPPPPVETLPPHPVNMAKKGIAKKEMAKKEAAREAEIEIESGSEKRMRGSFTVVFPILLRSGTAILRLWLAAARCPQARHQCARATHERQHDGRIFRRILASGLRAER